MVMQGIFDLQGILSWSILGGMGVIKEGYFFFKVLAGSCKVKASVNFHRFIDFRPNSPWCSYETLWEMLIWGYETMFFISESPDAFVTLLHLMFKWDFVGNVDLRAMRPYSLFLSLLMLLWHCCPWCSYETLWEMLIWGNETMFFISESPDAFVTLLHLMIKWDIMGNDDLGLWDHVLYFWVSWCFCDAVAPDVHMRLCWEKLIPRAMRPCSLFLSLLMLLWHCCTWWSNETLWEMLIWGLWDHILYFWVSWCFCDTVAPDVHMRLCEKWWSWGYETMFFISESPDAFVTLLHLMIKWDIMGNDDLGLWDHVLYFWVSWCFCDTVAPDDQMRLCWKCWFEGNETIFFISESPECFCDTVARDDQMGHSMRKWSAFGVTPDHVLYFWVSWCFVWHCCPWWSNKTLWEMSDLG